MKGGSLAGHGSVGLLNVAGVKDEIEGDIEIMFFGPTPDLEELKKTSIMLQHRI